MEDIEQVDKKIKHFESKVISLEVDKTNLEEEFESLKNKDGLTPEEEIIVIELENELRELDYIQKIYIELQTQKELLEIKLENIDSEFQKEYVKLV